MQDIFLKKPSLLNSFLTEQNTKSVIILICDQKSIKKQVLGSQHNENLIPAKDISQCLSDTE